MQEGVQETLALKLRMPRNRCAHCVRQLKSGERLELTFYHDGSLVTVTVCAACLQEHVPETFKELTRHQPRRFQ